MRDHAALSHARRDSGVSDKTSALVEAGETAAGALAVGLLAGRYGTANVPGTTVPLGLAAGVVGLGLSLYGVIPSKYADHAIALSSGALSGWMALYGLGMGQGMAEKAGQPTGTVAVGGLPGANVGCGPALGCMPQGRAALGPVTPYAGRNVRPLTEAEIAGIYARRAA